MNRESHSQAKKDLAKELLYDSVKTLVEYGHPHIQLPQAKLFTLFSIAFQFLLYQSTKKPGAYLIRVEDQLLADKLASKAKDETTRKFFSRLILPRKLSFERSQLYLDYFLPSTWAKTASLPLDKIRFALIIKNTSARPLDMIAEETALAMEKSDPWYFYTPLQKVAPQSILLSYGENAPGCEAIHFPFIVDEDDEPGPPHGFRKNF